MRQLRLGTQLNISFGLVLFVPMMIAAVFSIVYYSGKIEEEAVNTIDSEMKIAEIIYQNALRETGQLAEAYARKSILNFLIGRNLTTRIGQGWSVSAEQDRIHMIMVVDPDRTVLVRSHAPTRTGDIMAPRPYLTEALGGKTVEGIEQLQFSELQAEGLEVDSRLFAGSATVLCMTGAAPVYDRQRENIVGAVVVRRLLIGEELAVLSEIIRHRPVHAALFCGARLIAAAAADRESADFSSPPATLLAGILQENRPRHTAQISREGSIAKYMPIDDFSGTPVGILMVQAGVADYLATRNTAVVTLLLIFGIGMVLAFSVKTLVARRIVVPVQRLKKGAMRIGGGEYGTTLDVASGDEIGELTEAFNKMSGDLNRYDRQVKEHQRDLESRVRERTAELQVANDKLMDANRILEDTLETLHPGVSRLIKKKKQKLGLVFATELVADVCNYTKLNMILGETMMGEFMKRFFREAHQLLAQYHGMFDKTVGDQIVAIFGMPKDNSPARPIHPFDAVACALKLVSAAERINVLLQESIQDNYSAISERYRSLSQEDRESVRIEDLAFRCRIGINTSNPASDREIDRMRMVMMGAETCVDYTAQGGSVIYAFRLESFGKPGEIHIGENTRRIVERAFELEMLPAITLKGLGSQARYRVLGTHSVFCNVYPKTRFYQACGNRLPGMLERMVASIRFGRFELPEVKKLNPWLDVDIPYLEHLAGVVHFCCFRALLAYRLAESLGVEPERLGVIGFASLWHNGRRLIDQVFDTMEACTPESQTPEDLDAAQAAELIHELAREKPRSPDASVIVLCDAFDERVYDHSYAQVRKNETLSPKEGLSLLKIQDEFDPDLLAALGELMSAPECLALEAADPDLNGDGPPLPEDVDTLAGLICQRYDTAQRDMLLQRLSDPEKAG